MMHCWMKVACVFPMRPSAEARQRTEAGFRFMLQDTYHQLWQLLQAFIDLAHASAGANPQLLSLSCP